MAFEHNQHGVIGELEAPAKSAAVVTPDDSNDLAFTPRSLYIGVSGDVAVHMFGQTSAIVFKAVPVGILPICPDRVLVTGTTASSIIALW